MTENLGGVQFSILFQEEVSAWVAVYMHYVIDTCDCVRSIVFLPLMVGMSFMLVTLIWLNVSEPEHWLTWSHWTDINFLFWGTGEKVFLLNHIIFHPFLLLNILKTYFERAKGFLSGVLNLELIGVWWITNMVAAPPPPPILGGDLKISDQNNWGGPEQKIKFGGS